MPAERYYFPEILKADEIISLKEKEFHHLSHVMRTRVGESVEVVNGKGQLAEAIVDSFEKKGASLLIKSVETTPPPKERLILAQGMPRQNRLEFILEKGTELGMTDLWLFPAARSERKIFSENYFERLHFLAIAAMKQCGRLFLPNIMEMPPLKKWNEPQTIPLFFGDLSPQAVPFSIMCKKIMLANGAIFCIGPESGFSPDELVVLHQLNAHGVALHPNILTTDTAAIAALTLLSHNIYYSQ